MILGDECKGQSAESDERSGQLCKSILKLESANMSLSVNQLMLIDVYTRNYGILPLPTIDAYLRKPHLV